MSGRVFEYAKRKVVEAMTLGPPDDMWEKRYAQPEPLTVKPMRADANELAEAERWCRSEVFGTQRSHVLKTLLAEYDRRGEWVRSAGSTMVVLTLQCAELREALARVDPQAAAEIHARHKAHANGETP